MTVTTTPRAARESSSSLRDQAYAEILDSIVSLRLEPGTMLSEPSLARELGMSRTPVRAALDMVAADGLLKLVPNHGFVVEHTTPRTVSEVFEIREAIEGFAVRNANFEENRPRFVQFLALFSHFAEAAPTTNIGVRSMLRDADVLFHSEIVAGLRNGMAAALIDHQLALRGAYLRNLTSGKELREQQGSGGHAAIASAILRDDRAAADEMLAEHLHEGRDFFISRMASSRALTQAPRFPQVRQNLIDWLDGDDSSPASLAELVEFTIRAEPF